MTVRLKYHQAILDLLGVEPTLPADRVAVVAERERICGVRFPESVREWFSLADAEPLFHANTNSDHLTPPDELGDPAETRQGYLRVATENQGVVAWYVGLGDGDDPPVFHNNDDWNEDLKKTTWRADSLSFTNFIYDMLSSHHFRGWYSGRVLIAEDCLPDSVTLDRLRGSFRQGPSTDAPDNKAYRFFTISGRITIRSCTPEHRANRTADWEIETGSPEALLDFARKLWGIGTLARTLTAKGSPLRGEHPGEEVLRRLRAEFGA